MNNIYRGFPVLNAMKCEYCDMLMNVNSKGCCVYCGAPHQAKLPWKYGDVITKTSEVFMSTSTLLTYLYPLTVVHHE